MIIDYLEESIGGGTPHNTSRGMQYSYKCPLCDDYKERLFINPDRGKYKCHNCDSAGTIVTLIAEMEGIAWKDALSTYREYATYEFELPDSIEREVHERLIVKPEIELVKYKYPLPEEFILMEEARGRAGRQAYEYVKSRGISIDTCIEQYIGYCAEGKYKNRIIMPDFEDGELVYWQARTWLPEPKDYVMKKLYRKTLNPSLDEEQIADGVIPVDKSDIVSNIDFILEDGVAVLCEGRFDSYTIGRSGGCLHGKHMSDAQFIKLVTNKHKIDVIYVMFDGDALVQSVKTAKRLWGYFDNVYVCKLPKDKDPNSLGKRGVLNSITEALPYSPFFEVKARLKGWI